MRPLTCTVSSSVPPFMMSVPSPLLQTMTSTPASPLRVSLPPAPRRIVAGSAAQDISGGVADEAVAKGGPRLRECARAAGHVLDAGTPPVPVAVPLARFTLPPVKIWPRMAPPGKVAVWTLR